MCVRFLHLFLREEQIMSKTLRVVLRAGLVLATASSMAFAASPTSTQNEKTVAKLEQRAAQLTPTGTKFGAAQASENAQQRREIDSMIERLRAGQSVDPKEIDRLLGEASPWRE
jgi:hypothetical protein